MRIFSLILIIILLGLSLASSIVEVVGGCDRAQSVLETYSAIVFQTTGAIYSVLDVEIRSSDCSKYNVGDSETFVLAPMADGRLVIKSSTLVGAVRGITYAATHNVTDVFYGAPASHWRAYQSSWPLDQSSGQKLVQALALLGFNALHVNLGELAVCAADLLPARSLEPRVCIADDTLARLKELADYASDLGVDVIPRFDLPMVGGYPGYMRRGRALIAGGIRRIVGALPTKYFHYGDDYFDLETLTRSAEAQHFLYERGLVDAADYVNWLYSEMLDLTYTVGRIVTAHTLRDYLMAEQLRHRIISSLVLEHTRLELQGDIVELHAPTPAHAARVAGHKGLDGIILSYDTTTIAPDDETVFITAANSASYKPAHRVQGLICRGRLGLCAKLAATWAWGKPDVGAAKKIVPNMLE